MPISIIRETEGHLEPSGLLVGYSIKYFRWYDDDLMPDREPFICFRTDGGGESDPVGGVDNPDLQIMIVGKADTVIDAGELAGSIKSYLIENNRVGSVINYRSLADIGSPIYLNNNRPMFVVNLRLTTTRQAS